MSYIDTSVLAAYYCPEPLSATVDKLLTNLNGPALSQLSEVELVSALSQKVRTGQLDTAAAHQIRTQFQAHLASGYYELLPVNTREYHLARDWISQFSTSLRTLDALHLAVAFSN